MSFTKCTSPLKLEGVFCYILPMSAKKPHVKKRPRQSIKAGLAPGTPVFVGHKLREQARIDLLDFDEANLEEMQGVSLETCMDRVARPSVTWLHINGVHDLQIIESLGRKFNLHPLTLEDMVNTRQRPKIEDYPEYLFIVLKQIRFKPDGFGVSTEQISLVLGHGFVLSLMEDVGDVFEPVRLRLRTSKGRIRILKADYLAYALMDSVVDHYFLAVEELGDQIESLDERLSETDQDEVTREIHRLKHELMVIRKAVAPLREELRLLVHNPTTLIQPETRMFLRDLLDHVIQVLEMLETCREELSGVHDTHMFTLSHRMNEVIKVLTILSSVFIPLTFIAGVYGMNFQVMPELGWEYGYPAVWVLMLCIAALMLIYFRYRRWL